MNESDLIHVHDMKSLCDSIYDNGDEPPPGVIFCPTENIKKFFRECRRHPYVVVSADSDYCLALQSENHPNADLARYSLYVRWGEVARERDKYIIVPVGPACDSQACQPTDRYSLKTYAYTGATFPEIPPNVVRWFVANTSVTEPRVQWIPFGLPGGRTSPVAFCDIPKKELLYVNFQRYTDERVVLLNHFATQPWVTFVPTPDLHPDDYLRQLASHKFVLCPEGNGYDCYRTYEALYTGSIPLMRRSKFSENLERAGLPVLLVNDIKGVTEDSIWREYLVMVRGDYDFSSLSLSYWKVKLAEARSFLASPKRQ